MHFSLGLGVWRYSLLFDFVASWTTTRLISRSPTGSEVIPHARADDRYDAAAWEPQGWRFCQVDTERNLTWLEWLTVPLTFLTLPVITHQPSGAGMKVRTDIIASDSASLPHLHYLLHTKEPRIDCLQT
jgi:hypothetical protein